MIILIIIIAIIIIIIIIIIVIIIVVVVIVIVIIVVIILVVVVVVIIVIVIIIIIKLSQVINNNTKHNLLPVLTLTLYFLSTLKTSNSRRLLINKCVSRTDTNPPFAFQTAFPRGTDFSVSTGRVKKLHTLLASLYF